MQFLRNLSLTEYFKENPKRIRFAFSVTWIYISPLTIFTHHTNSSGYFLNIFAMQRSNGHLRPGQADRLTQAGHHQASNCPACLAAQEVRVTQQSTELHWVTLSTGTCCLTGVILHIALLAHRYTGVDWQPSIYFGSFLINYSILFIYFVPFTQ